jgi:hypothetical protein
VVSIDAASSTIVVKDLVTKKQVTVRVTPDVQMRRLPDRMAQMLAARLKGGSGGGQGGWSGGAQQAGAAGGPQRTGQGQNGGSGAAGATNSGGGQWAGSGGAGGQGGPGGGDAQQMLSRAPAIQLSDLQKGEAVMLVSTEGTSDVTAVTLLAGVEPLLEAPAASNLLSNWSMGGGGAEAAAAQ